MKILIIGNAGFIGNFLSRELIESGYEVIGMDIRPPKINENPYHFIQGDILNPKDIMKAARDANAIIHLAAKHHDFGISKAEFFKVNVKGTQNILDCAAKLGINKLIFYSTVGVYGNNKEHPREDTLPNPENYYAESKLDAEKAVYRWTQKDSNRQAVIIRPAVVFGPYNYANMYNLINQIYKKRFIFIGKGDNIKSIAYVENLVDATLFLLKRLKPGLEIYNYTDYPQMTTEQIVQTITNYLGCRVPKIKIPLELVLAMVSIFDLAEKLTGYNFPITAKRIKKFNTTTQFESYKIRSLGFQPKVDLSDGFKRMVEWYLSNGNASINTS